MYQNRPCIGDAVLLLVDLVEEAEDSSRVVGYTMVRPAQVLVVPDLTHSLALRIAKHPTGKTASPRMLKQQQRDSSQQLPGLGVWWLPDPGVGWQLLVTHTHIILRAHAEVPEFVLQGVVLPCVLHKVGAILLRAAQLWPVRHTFVLCGQRGQGEDGQKAGEREKAEQWLKGDRDTSRLLLTRPFSTSRVVITIMRVFSCHTICQKSLTVASRQPWLAM